MLKFNMGEAKRVHYVRDKSVITGYYTNKLSIESSLHWSHSNAFLQLQGGWGELCTCLIEVAAYAVLYLIPLTTLRNVKRRGM